MIARALTQPIRRFTPDKKPSSTRRLLTPAHDTDILGSELIDPATFSANPVAGAPAPAKITGFGASLSADASAKITGTQVVPGTMANGGTFSINGQNVVIQAGMTPAQVLVAINAAVSLNGTGGFTGAGGTIGGASTAAITIAATGLNGGVPLSVATMLTTDTAARSRPRSTRRWTPPPAARLGISVDGSSGQLV